MHFAKRSYISFFRSLDIAFERRFFFGRGGIAKAAVADWIGLRLLQRTFYSFKVMKKAISPSVKSLLLYSARSMPSMSNPKLL